MKMKKIALLSMMAASGLVNAQVPTLPGATPLYFKFDGEEVISTTNFTGPNGVTENSFGIFTLAGIYDGKVSGNTIVQQQPNNPIWTSGQGGGQIVGVFDGLQAASAPGYAVASTGGSISLYWVPTTGVDSANTATISSDFLSASSAIGPGLTVKGVTDATLLSTINFATGIIPTGTGSTTVTVAGTVGLTNPGFSGEAYSYGNVLAGSGPWSAALAGQFYSTTQGNRDFSFSDNYVADPTSTGWTNYAPGAVAASFSDPAGSFTVPEPATLALLGLGMIGLAAGRSKKSV